MRRGSLLLAVLGGALVSCSTPPVRLGAAAFLGCAVLDYASRVSGGRAGERALLGLSFGAVANASMLYFIPDVISRFSPLPKPLGYVALALLALAQGIPWAFAVICRDAFVRIGAPASVAFAVSVYLADFVPMLFPWDLSACLSASPVWVQSADWVGSVGASSFVAFVASLASGAVTRGGIRRALPQGLLAFSLVVCAWAYGRARMRSFEEGPSGRHLRVGLVQPDTGALERWDASHAIAIHDRLLALTKEAEAGGAELVVWPESAYPYPLEHGATECVRGQRPIRPPGKAVPIVVGFMGEGEVGEFFNSAAVCSDDGALGPPYDKVDLLWFGETVPFAGTFPFLRRTFFRGLGLVPGDRTVILSAAGTRLGVLNCYEDTLPSAARRTAIERPDFLVNITNDAWFLESPASELHLWLAVMRAIETRRDLVRAVNKGETAWVSASGEIVARLERQGEGVLLADAALRKAAPTPFTRAGRLPVLLCLLLCMLVRVARLRSGSSDSLSSEATYTLR